MVQGGREQAQENRALREGRYDAGRDPSNLAFWQALGHLYATARLELIRISRKLELTSDVACLNIHVRRHANRPLLEWRHSTPSGRG